MLEVTQARYGEGYKIWVEFNDGTSGVVDLAGDLWGPVFEPLRDLGQFRRFAVSNVLHTVAWENGEDFAPEFLHNKLDSRQPEPASISRRS
jgi:hypothetical protein